MSKVSELLRALEQALCRRPATRLAAWRRQRLTRPVFVGITGTAGKTTCKDLTVAVLSTLGPGTWSPGNFNGLRTVVKTLCRTRQSHRFCVHELAAHAPGNVRELADCFRPDIGVVLNIELEHYTAFRTRDAIAREKGNLIAVLPANGTAVLNADDQRVMDMRERTTAAVTTFGLSPTADFRAENVRYAWPAPLCFDLVCRHGCVPVRTALHGRHWVHAVLAAIAIGDRLGVAPDAAARALAAVEPADGRLEPVETRGGVTFLRDDRKFPYWAVDTFLALVREAQATRKVIVFGTLSDYPGSASPKYRAIARNALQSADQVVFVGNRTDRYLRKITDDRDRLTPCTTLEAAGKHLRNILQPGDLVFLKGSEQCDGLEQLIGIWQEDTP